MKTERIVLVVSPKEKAQLNEKAAKLRITLSDLMRLGAFTYKPDDAVEQLDERLTRVESALKLEKGASDQ